MKKMLLLLALVPAAACASAQAKVPIDRPVLDVPPVPARVIEPLPAPAPEKPMLQPVTDLPQAGPGVQDKPKPRPKPEPSKPEPPPVVEPPPAVPPPVPTVPPLRTPNTASDGAEASRQVREALDRAKKTLDAVDYRVLNTEQQELYNQAKLFLVQSEDKLKSSDFELARNYADRAEQIAKQLQKR